ncbi:MAG: UvrD-helicase domain-containing protein [Azonexus sp.]|nr:UvrD-helicase domain-containing protein [Azonexus sp.]MCK6411539.1 UvrD-helicase domain-containing protein [Azonexus sp.]
MLDAPLDIPNPLLEDTAARQRALDLASFIVEAPAGAGKTELLTQRTLRLLAVVDNPEEVLALTFTNKAATEMRDRILGSLELAAGGELPAAPHKQLTFRLASAVLQRDRERGWSLLQHPGRLRITTLDALCANLARQMPFLSRFGAQPGVADDAEAHYATAARRTLAMLEADDDAAADAEVVAAALAFMDNHAGRLERLLIAMLGRRDQWLQHAARINHGGEALRAEIEAGFALLTGRALQSAAERLDARWQTRLLPLARFAAGNGVAALAPLLDRSEPARAVAADLPAWRALASLLLTSSGSLRQKLDKRCGFPADKEAKPHKEAMSELLAELANVSGLPEALAAVADLPTPHFSPAEWSTVAGFARLLQLAAGQLWLVFQEAGAVDFIEIAARAGLALGDDEAPTDLAQALDYRIQHLLVDEFQDTSPGQVELIARLMRGWQPGDGRTLFVVGDPMQSIYRFRKAEVGLFLRVRERGIGDVALEHLRLFRNNRSYPGIVDWVNRAFPSIFPAQDAPETGAVCYAPSAATRPPEAASGVQVHPVFADSDDAAGDEARVVLDLILQARAQQRAGEPQERVAVLVRARSHLDALVGEIRRSAPELRFSAVEIEGLAERQHIEDLLTLYRALSHRADRIHWLALLRGPCCGLTLADLLALAGGDKQRTVWQLMHAEERLAALSDDGRARLLSVRAVLAQALAERGRMPPRRWLEGSWVLLGGPRTLASPEEMADVAAFFQLVDQLSADGRLAADELAARTAELYAPPDPLAGEAVQMMTIHKSKGLEFETVIVPGLHRDTGMHESSLLLWDQVADADGQEHLLVAPLRSKVATSDEGGESSDGASLYDLLRRVENERSAHEDERLLYVAATRAIRRLHLVGVAKLDPEADDGLKVPASGTLLRLLWPGEAQPVFAAALAEREALSSELASDSSVVAEEAEAGRRAPPLRRLREVGPPPELAAVPPPRDADNWALTPLSATGVALDASVGTLVHRCLELIARQGLAQWPAERLPGLQAGWQRWLRGLGHGAEEAASGAAEALVALQRTLHSETGRWLLAAHPEAGCEQAWTSLEAAAGGPDSELSPASTVNHVIDRIFVADGVRWIIDYKTVRLAADEDQASALRRRAEGFRPQLERYAALFAGDPRPLKMAIWFALQGRLLVLDSP